VQEVSKNNSNELEKRYRTSVIVVAAQILSVLLLIVIAWAVIANSDNSMDAGSQRTVWFFILFIAIGSFLVRRFLFNWDRLKNTAILKGIPAVLQTLQMNSIMLGALGEIVAVMGFILATMSGNSWEMFRAGAVAMVVFLANFPRKATWKKIVYNLEKIEV
jgi:H+/Cl- antiporter ClcA